MESVHLGLIAEGAFVIFLFINFYDRSKVEFKSFQYLLAITLITRNGNLAASAIAVRGAAAYVQNIGKSGRCPHLPPYFLSRSGFNKNVYYRWEETMHLYHP